MVIKLLYSKMFFLKLTCFLFRLIHYSKTAWSHLKEMSISNLSVGQCHTNDHSNQNVLVCVFLFLVRVGQTASFCRNTSLYCNTLLRLQRSLRCLQSSIFCRNVTIGSILNIFQHLHYQNCNATLFLLIYIDIQNGLPF